MDNLQQSTLFDHIEDGKVCKRCKQWKPMVKFCKSARCIGGRNHTCIKCSRDPEKVKQSDRKRYEKHKEKIKNRVSAHRKQNRESINAKKREASAVKRALQPRKTKSRNYGLSRKQDSKLYAAKWRADNQSRIPAYMKKWKESSPESAKRAAKNSAKNYRRNHPERVREIYRTMRQRRRAAPGSYTVKEWLALCEKYNGKCLCCLEIKPLTVDHIIPISKGGTNDIDNLQPLCMGCNNRKYAKTIDYRPKEDLNS